MAVGGVERGVDDDDGRCDVLPRVRRRNVNEEKGESDHGVRDVRVVARCGTRRNQGRTTHDLGTIGFAIWDDLVYRLGGYVLLGLLLGLLLVGDGTNP
jgi:hypothetical protein